MTHIHLTVKQAISCLNDGDNVHVFSNAIFGLIGADWSRKEIIELFEQADDIQIGGDACRNIKHGIVVFPKNAKYQSDLWFVKCNDNKLAEYDTNEENNNGK